MQLPKSLTTVTTLSKTIALAIFILFPFLGFVAGKQYQSLVEIPEVQYITKTVVKEVVKQEDFSDTLKRCGEFPILPKSSQGDQRIQVVGPHWSPDCRNIAWSTNVMVYGNEGGDPSAASPSPDKSTTVPTDSGVYVYNDAARTTAKIYSPDSLSDVYTLEQWNNRNSVRVMINGKSVNYSLQTRTLK